MIVKELIEPKSIAVVGASNNAEKPGGKVLRNLIDGGYKGKLYPVNLKEDEIFGLKSYKNPAEIGDIDLAIMAIDSKYIPATMEFLASQNNTKAFIVLSAGFSEIGEEGKLLEDDIISIANKYDCSLIGPNCTGVLTPAYSGSFAGPLPKLESHGVDFVSGSGATAVFILETAIPMGIPFSSVFSVGNSALVGVEEVLEYWDEKFDPGNSSKVKIIYIEQVDKPDKFLKHCRSLIQKGCRIAAIKAGTTDAGTRAVSSHTGALAVSDNSVDALFRKAGVIRCYGREELAYVAGVLMHKELHGKNIAVITHAGGPGVMLTDALSKGGLKVPHIEGKAADELKSQLFHGSSVANPIDFLATGNAEQLGKILDYVENEFDNIDGSVVIFGTPGLFDVKPVYKVLHEKMLQCKKPIFPVLPSVVQVMEAIEYFKSFGRIYFKDEVLLGEALAKVQSTPKPFSTSESVEVDKAEIRKIIEDSANGYLLPEKVSALLDAAGIKRAPEMTTSKAEDAVKVARSLGYPIVMKVVGPVHKSDVGGVVLNVDSDEKAVKSYTDLMKIEGAEAVLFQKMVPKGTELFIGAKKDPGFGHIVLCGIGGIFIEILKDVAYGLTPISNDEADYMIKGLRSYALIKGVRGQQGVNEEMFRQQIVRLSALLEAAPEIAEMDLNPLIGTEKSVIAVDARIRVEKDT
jgi:acyl-CoA synthetase (NDP forming)